MSIYAEYSHGLMDEEEFHQTCLDEERLYRIRTEPRHDEEYDEDDDE